MQAARTHLERAVPQHMKDIEMRLLCICGEGHCGKTAFTCKLLGPTASSPMRRRAAGMNDDDGMSTIVSSMVPNDDDDVDGHSSSRGFAPVASLGISAGMHGIVVGHGAGVDHEGPQRVLQVFDQPEPWGCGGANHDVESLLPAFLCPGSIIVWHTRAAELFGGHGYAALQPLFLLCQSTQLFRAGCLKSNGSQSTIPQTLLLVVRDFDGKMHLPPKAAKDGIDEHTPLTSATKWVQKYIFAKEPEVGVVGAAGRNRMRDVISQFFGRMSVHLVPIKTSPLSESAEQGLLVDCFMSCAVHDTPAASSIPSGSPTVPGCGLITARQLGLLFADAESSINVSSSPVSAMAGVDVLSTGHNAGELAAHKVNNYVQVALAELRTHIDALVSGAFGDLSCAATGPTPSRALQYGETPLKSPAAGGNTDDRRDAPQPVSLMSLTTAAKQKMEDIGSRIPPGQSAAREKFKKIGATMCEDEVQTAVTRVNGQRVAGAEIAVQKQCAVLVRMLEDVLAGRERYADSQRDAQRHLV